jgi:hypothetical protein
MHLFSKGNKPDRPYFKLCKACEGKGTKSSFDAAQTKQYQQCDSCANTGYDAAGLGVMLKCSCQDPGSPYNVLSTETLHKMKGVNEDHTEHLRAFQTRVAPGELALLVLCTCGVSYLANSGQARKMPPKGCNTEREQGVKDFNRGLADEMIERGVLSTLKD